MDPGSFRELGALTGTASYDANFALRCASGQYRRGTGKVEGENLDKCRRLDHSWRLLRCGYIGEVDLLERYAEEMRIPLVRLVESAGGSVKLLDKNAATKLPTYPSWHLTRMMGKIPVVGLALGACAGLGALKVAASHYSVMVKESRKYSQVARQWLNVRWALSQTRKNLAARISILGKVASLAMKQRLRKKLLKWREGSFLYAIERL